MTVRSVGLLALHSCPLTALGTGKAGGMSSYVLGLAREFSRRGITVKIITNEHTEGHGGGELCDGFEVVHVASGAADEIAGALGADCELIHSHYWVSGLAGMGVARRLGAPHVTTFHTIGVVKEEAWVPAFAGMTEGHRERVQAEGVVARGVDGIVAWTRFEADALVSMLGAERERIAVAPIGVDTDRFRPLDTAEARRCLGIGADEETLLYVGRLDRIKGADVLLRAAGLLIKRPWLRVRFVGGEVDANYAAGLRTLAADLNIADRISWVGPVPNDELPWHYAAADVVVVPSYSESFSIAATEAMACGRPVVASNVPGPASFIEDGVSGRLAPAGDAPALARSVGELLDDDALRERLGEGALAAARGMTWGASAETALGLYERVIEVGGEVGSLDSSLRSE